MHLTAFAIGAGVATVSRTVDVETRALRWGFARSNYEAWREGVLQSGSSAAWLRESASHDALFDGTSLPGAFGIPSTAATTGTFKTNLAVEHEPTAARRPPVIRAGSYEMCMAPPETTTAPPMRAPTPTTGETPTRGEQPDSARDRSQMTRPERAGTASLLVRARLGSLGAMAEPTLKDVLNAIAGFRADSERRFGALEKGQAALEKGQGALEKGQAALDAKVEALGGDMNDRFDALEEKVDTFRGVLASHREDTRDLEADVIAIHKGLVRAKLPYIPKDLPSQVRAKGERSSKPAARLVRRRRAR